jgi:CubicO group peptidase (beta-lactamase class C family)
VAQAGVAQAGVAHRGAPEQVRRRWFRTLPAAAVCAIAVSLALLIGSGFVPGGPLPGHPSVPAGSGGTLAPLPVSPTPSGPGDALLEVPTSAPLPVPTEGPGPSPQPAAGHGPPASAGDLGVNSGLRVSARFAAELKRTLNAARKRYALPGVSAAILWPDGRLWVGVAGYADLQSQRGVTADTAFSIGSITKTFTAALILQLAEDGILSLDDPVTKWIPVGSAATSPPVAPGASPASPGSSAASPGPPASPGAAAAPASPVGPGSPLASGLLLVPQVTVRRLLDHTSGLDDFFASGALDSALRRPKTRFWFPAEVLRYAAAPRAAPGALWSYSNTNYVLLGLIAERATGMCPWP